MKYLEIKEELRKKGLNNILSCLRKFDGQNSYNIGEYCLAYDTTDSETAYTGMFINEFLPCSGLVRGRDCNNGYYMISVRTEFMELMEDRELKRLDSIMK